MSSFEEEVFVATALLADDEKQKRECLGYLLVPLD
jgi:hypothetical protein